MIASPDNKQSEGKSLFVMVGDVSADKHTARVIAKLNELEPQLHIWGVGGPNMVKQNFEALPNTGKFSVIGIENFQQLTFLAKMRAELTEQVATRKPDVVLLVDYSGFNLLLAKSLRKRFPDLPILYFISPQVWGSRPWRIKTIAKTVTKMLVIFPFEEPLYRSHGIDTRFVGHPLSGTLPAVDTLGTREELCQSLRLDPSKHIVGIFPGSRKGEIRAHLPVIMQAIKTLRHMRNDVQFVISASDQDSEKRIKAQTDRQPDSATCLIAAEKNYALMHHADLLWAKSGTTTLEAAMYVTPMLIFYDAPWPHFLIYLAVKQVKRVGLPNLLAGESLVPELIKLDCRAELLVRYTGDLLDVPGVRREISEKLAGLRSKLGEGEYTSNCASEILKAVHRTASLQ